MGLLQEGKRLFNHAPRVGFAVLTTTSGATGLVADNHRYTKDIPAMRININTLPQNPDHNLVWDNSWHKNPLFVDNPISEEKPKTLIDDYLSRTSKELELNEYGTVFDYYFSLAMERFKLTGPKKNPMIDTDGTASFYTDTGYRITLTRSTQRNGYVDGLPTTSVERKLVVGNLNNVPEYPGNDHNLSVTYTFVENSAPTKTSQIKRIEPGGFVVLDRTTTMTKRDMFDVATALKYDFDKTKDTGLPNTFRPIPHVHEA